MSSWGCQAAKVAKPTGGVAPLSEIRTQENVLDQKIRDIEAASTRRDARVAASLYLVRDYNQKNPEPISMEVIGREIDLVLRELGIDPDMVALSAARSRARLVEEGKKSEADKAYGAALAAAGKASEEVGKLRAEKDALRASLVDQLSKKENELIQNQQENQRLVDELRKKDEEYRKSLRAWTARILIGLGVLGVVATGVLVWLSFGTGGLSVVKKGAGAWAGSLLLIGSGFIVNQPWFMWACGGAILIFLIGLAVLIWRSKQTDRTLKKTTQTLEEVKIDNPQLAKSIKEEYEDVNLDDAQKSIMQKARARIDKTYVQEVIQKRAGIHTETENPNAA